MPAVVQHLVSSGYGYVDPLVTRVRKTVPLVDKTAEKIETCVPQMIQTVDKHINVAYDAAEKRVVTLKGNATAVQGQVHQKLFGEGTILCRMHQGCIMLVDRSEALLDQLLPSATDKATHVEIKNTALIPRVISIPAQIPVRVTRIVLVKAGQTVRISNQWVTVQVLDKKAQFSQHVSRGAAFISEKLASAPGAASIVKAKTATSQKLQVLWQGVVDGQKATVIWVKGRLYVVYKQAHIPELQEWTSAKISSLKQSTDAVTTRATERTTAAKDWTSRKVCSLKQSTAEGATAAKARAAEGATQVVQGAYAATARVAGGQKAVALFTRVGTYVPAVTSAVGLDVAQEPAVVEEDKKFA